MDDILIIVLTLAFTVLAAINQNKKKKHPAEGESKLPDFWKVLFPEAEARDVHLPEEMREMTAPVRPVPQSFKQVKRKEPSPDFQAEGVRNERVTRIPETKIPEPMETETIAESISEDFTLRKAVIYSEILRPKYF